MMKATVHICTCEYSAWLYLHRRVQSEVSLLRRLICSSKMAEDFKQGRGDLNPPPSTGHQPEEPEDICVGHSQLSVSSQLTQEKLYQRRQKCELRRLLKHTHPELKKLDDVVDEELAEVLGSETRAPAGETGYEGEILSRRLIFEKCPMSDTVSPYTPKRNVGKETAQRGDNSTAVVEECEEMPCHENVKWVGQGDKTAAPTAECEDERISVDVKATRRIFEDQSRLNADQLQWKATFPGNESGAAPKLSANLQTGNKSNAATKMSTAQPAKQEPDAHILSQNTDHDFSRIAKAATDEIIFEDETTSPSEPEISGENIKTSAALFQNNPFISANIERENTFVPVPKPRGTAGESGEARDHLVTNVKSRAHLFESLPFDKIKHQNKDEVEAMVKNIKETLGALHRIRAIHSAGSIVEVNETMIAKRAKFTLSEDGPSLNYEEVAEGGAQNLILQLLPRTNLKPQITYLKEDYKGGMAATKINVHVHQRQFSGSQESEFKTANVIQVVEDILNQDNSLRKGVVIQENVDTCAEVIVYSLYKYFDEEDVKSYCPPQSVEDKRQEPEGGEGSKGKEADRSAESCAEDQTCRGSPGDAPEVEAKGHVKLFWNCFEKGDLECLRSFQAQTNIPEQEAPSERNSSQQSMELDPGNRGDQAEENLTEWVPVDVKKLKNMFSGDQMPLQPKQSECENLPASTSISCKPIRQDGPPERKKPTTECTDGVFASEQLENNLMSQEEACKNTTQRPHLRLETFNDDVLKAELVDVVDDIDEISDLQTAIETLQRTTIEAKSLNQKLQQKQKFLVEGSAKEPADSVTTGGSNYPRTEARENEDGDPNITARQNEESVTDISDHKLDGQHEEAQISHHASDPEEVKSTETCSKQNQKDTQMAQKSDAGSEDSSETTAAQQEGEEVVLQGKLQAALNSLERSNINVTRGDFRAAMIYRNSSNPHKGRSQYVDVSVRQEAAEKETCPVTEPEANQVKPSKEVSKASSGAQSDSKTVKVDVSAEKSRRPVGPKPAIPPKPEHLKARQRDVQSTRENNPQITRTSTVKLKENVHSDENPGFEPDNPKTKNISDESVPVCQETELRQQSQSLIVTSECKNTDHNISVTADEIKIQDFADKKCLNKPDGIFHEENQITGGEKPISIKNAPVKPKRVKIAQQENKNLRSEPAENPSPVLTQVLQKPQQTVTDPPSKSENDKDKREKASNQECKVEMRDKKGRMETEDERRQRLSVHMDEIMKGNIIAAMEIFDNLRKQEELQSILSRVEEIEKDTSEVDVRSLRGVFENVPDWVVSSNKKKQRVVKEENKEERMPLIRDTAENKSSMAHVFGDLARASEEIMNLKEQTLARLMDIEGAIKKALYSVSTLKSESDIAGLSCLFKESLGTAVGSPASTNISKISIGSSRTRSVPAPESSTAQETTAPPASQEVATARQRSSPPSSPAFISIQSAARKTSSSEGPPPGATFCPACQHSPKTEKKFRTSKTLTCNSPAQNRKRDPRKGGQKQSSPNQQNPRRELSVLEVQTDSEGNSIMGTKTVTENYERTDNFGNRFYSTTTSTVITTQAETATSSAQAAISPATFQVTKYPEVRLPINQKT